MLRETPRDSKSLPFSEDAEKGVLCSLIKSPREVSDLCVLRLRSDAFYVPAHQLIYNLVIEFIDKSNPIDFVSLKQGFKDRDQLEEIGGPEFLSSLYSFVPTAANAAYYIEIVREKHLLRRLISTCNKLASRCYDPQEEIEPLFDGAEKEIFLITGEHQCSSGFPRFQTFGELSEVNLPEPKVLVDGILHAGSKMGFGGSSKSYKTWGLVDLALSVAAGRDWLGRGTNTGRVLYINLEIQEAFFKKRIEAVAAAKGLPLSGDWQNNLTVWNLRGYCARAEALCDEMARRTRNADPFALIIFDPIYKILGGKEENSNDQIASLLNRLERVARETGAAVAYGQHFSKGNQAAKDAIDRVAGAGVFARDPDTIVTLTKHESDGAYTVECTLRNFPPVDPFVVRWEYPLFVPDRSLDPEKLKQIPRGRAPKWTVSQLVDCLGDRDLTSTEFQKLVHGEIGMPRTVFFELLPKAKNQGLLHKCVTDDKWEVAKNNSATKRKS